jgi:hypothetical protein
VWYVNKRTRLSCRYRARRQLQVNQAKVSLSSIKRIKVTRSAPNAGHQRRAPVSCTFSRARGNEKCVADEKERGGPLSSNPPLINALAFAHFLNPSASSFPRVDRAAIARHGLRRSPLVVAPLTGQHRGRQMLVRQPALRVAARVQVLDRRRDRPELITVMSCGLPRIAYPAMRSTSRQPLGSTASSLTSA